MNAIITHYFDSFIHPFKYQTQLHQLRSIRRGPNTQVGINFPEAISMSWFFIIIDVFFVLLSLELSLWAAQHIRGSFPEIPLINFNFSQAKDQFWLFMGITSVLSFPFFAIFDVVFWRIILRFCIEIFGSKEDLDEGIDQVISSSYSSHILLIVPVFGSVFKTIYRMVLIYAGLRNNLQLSKKQSFFILAMPFVLTGLINSLIFALVLFYFWMIFFT